MKFNRAKCVHVLLFALFASLPGWLVLSSDSTLVKVSMLALIALMAKWAFLDDFTAADRETDGHRG